MFKFIVGLGNSKFYLLSKNMMGVTHALMGITLGLFSLVFLPDFIFIAGIAGFLGGLFPDLDLALNHRKTLHFPIGYTLLTILASILFFWFEPSRNTVFIWFFSASALIHSFIHILGGGLETRPWIPSSEKSVYSHTLDKWFKPRRLIRYDGSPEDLLLSLVLGSICFWLYDGILEFLSIAGIFMGIFYTILRKKLIDWIPDRYL